MLSKASIESQQADLQAKILSLLGSSAVVPSIANINSRPPQRPTTAAARGQYSQPTANYPPRPSLGLARPAAPRW